MLSWCVVLGAFTAFAASQDLKCIGRDLCTDTVSGKSSTCAKWGYACCVVRGEILQLLKAPRGTMCCHGVGLYNMQTHLCREHTVVQRPGVRHCPSSQILYNPSTQTCCQATRDSQPTVHLTEPNGLCCGSDYVSASSKGCCDGKPYDKSTECCESSTVMPKEVCKLIRNERDNGITCAGPSICKDEHTGEKFQCIETDFECCRFSDGSVQLVNAPRGTSCCQGAGMYNHQTHVCSRGSVIKRPDTSLCFNSALFYNINTQVCCYATDNTPVVHMKNPDKSCCGAHYIRDSTQGCCNGSPYDKSTQCCKRKDVFPKHVCDNNYTTCPPKNCTLDENEFTADSNLKGALYVYSFQAGESVNFKHDYAFFTVADVKQLKGIAKGKVTSTENARVKRLGLWKCGCSADLEDGRHYILFTKSRLRSSSSRLREGKFHISTVENSAALLQLFNL